MSWIIPLHLSSSTKFFIHSSLSDHKFGQLLVNLQSNKKLYLVFIYMRKKIVAGNWKMNTTVPEGVELAKAVLAKSGEVPAEVKLIVATPFTHLCPVAEVLKGSKVGLSAENCADKEKGAYTGEVSAAMLASAGCQYTILGRLMWRKRSPKQFRPAELLYLRHWRSYCLRCLRQTVRQVRRRQGEEPMLQ